MELSKQKVNEIIGQSMIASEIFGVDPGKSNGGIAKYSDRISVQNMKEFYRDGDEQAFDYMREYWEYQKSICKLPLIFLENITTYTGDASGKNGKHFGIDKLKRHYSELRLAIKSSGIQFIELMPRVWMNGLNYYMPNEERDVRKRRLADIARENFHTVKVTNQTADALLIMQFGVTKLKYDDHWILQRLKKHEKKVHLFNK